MDFEEIKREGLAILGREGSSATSEAASPSAPTSSTPFSADYDPLDEIEAFHLDGTPVTEEELEEIAAAIFRNSRDLGPSDQS